MDNFKAIYKLFLAWERSMDLPAFASGGGKRVLPREHHRGLFLSQEQVGHARHGVVHEIDAGAFCVDAACGMTGNGVLRRLESDLRPCPVVCYDRTTRGQPPLAAQSL